MYQLMSTGSILSILAYPQYGYHLVYHTGLSLVHCSYLSVGSLQIDEGMITGKKSKVINSKGGRGLEYPYSDPSSTLISRPDRLS